MLLKVIITQKVIDRSERRHGSRCVLANGIADTLASAGFVCSFLSIRPDWDHNSKEYILVFFDKPMDAPAMINLPKEASELASNYDYDLNVHPCEFTVEIPNELLRKGSV